MKIISIINLKGGVAKTVSAINIAHVLAMVHGYRVLLVDNDKQGNTSKFFGTHSYDAPSIADVLTTKEFPLLEAIRETAYDRMHILPANMKLLRANKEMLLDCSRPQQTRLKKALLKVSGEYDYTIIDNAPDINMSVINALVACNDVLIPIKVDNFAFDGVAQILEQVEEVREFNEGIRVAGGFVTMWQRNNVNTLGETYLREREGLPMFKAVIRKTVAVDETTFAGVPLLAYAKNSTAARDYVALVAEYLKL
jgi:chromosome partitioning protein